VVITVRKCRNKVKHYQAACRDVRQEARESEPSSPPVGWRMFDREPTPLEAAVFAEILERLQQTFDPEDQSIVALYLQGRSVQEISHQLQRAERTVRRVCQRVRKRLERELTEDAR
jgi:RNA polymerase sigma-70 factor (ECF subfamily)